MYIQQYLRVCNLKLFFLYSLRIQIRDLIILKILDTIMQKTNSMEYDIEMPKRIIIILLINIDDNSLVRELKNKMELLV